jgi:hypothetical protein
MAIALAGFVLAVLLPSGPVPSPAPADVPRLIAQMKASYGSSAVFSFQHIGQPAVPALIEVLSDRTLPDFDSVKQPARYQAALALAHIGPPAREAVPTLLAILRDRQEPEGMRWSAASALGAIGDRPDEVVPALLAVLDEPRIEQSNLGWYVVGALSQLAVHHPSARPALVRVLPTLRRAHQRFGGSSSFVEMFRALEPPSPARLAEESAIQAILVRQEVAKDAETWCLGASVSDAAFARLKGLKVTRSMDECQATRTDEPAAPNATPRLYQALDVKGIDWLSRTRVHAETEACFGHDPCFITNYEMERRGGKWIIVSESTPPAL